MKSNKNLVLLGMMGSGKSTIGLLLSKKLNIKFIDVDHKIENDSGMKITEIFIQKGEKYFRNLEEKITLKLLNSSNNVIALGGGGFINDKIRKEILKNNFSFWLYWNNLSLLDRIKKNNKRPIASKLSDFELIELIAKREKIYIKAQFKINCNKLKKTEIVKKIIKLYERD
jgi:shikimate kinase